MKKLVCIVVVLPALAFADPGPATQYLINEPASLMDIGLTKARLHFDMAQELIESTYEHNDPTLLFHSTIDYQFEDDLIVTELQVTLSGDKKLRCEDLMARYSTMLKNLMPDWFSHEGYSASTLPDDFENRLLNRVEIRCITQSSEARRKLLDNKVYWTGY